MANAIVAAAVLATVALVGGRRLGRAGVAIAMTAGVSVGLAGPTAFSIATAASPHSGAIPSAGPSSGRGFGGGGRGGFRGGRGGGPRGARGGFPTGVPALGGANAGAGMGSLFPGAAVPAAGATAAAPAGAPAVGRGGAGGGGLGGLLSASTPTDELIAVLDRDADAYTWVAATVGSNQSSGYQLATGDPVMAIGGFNGTDPTPTLAQFQASVAAGQIHWFIAGNAGGFGGGNGGNDGIRGANGGSNVSSAITAWVEANFTATTVGNATLYDLTPGA